MADAQKLAHYTRMAELWATSFFGEYERKPTDADRHSDAQFQVIARKLKKYSGQKRGRGRQGKGHKSASKGKDIRKGELADPFQTMTLDERITISESMRQASFKLVTQEERISLQEMEMTGGLLLAQIEGSFNDVRRSLKASVPTTTTFSETGGCSGNTAISSSSTESRRGATSAPATTPPSGPAGLPALPTPIAMELATSRSWVLSETRARAALEKCDRWTTAFTQTHGDPPTAEVKAASSIYSSSERTYLECHAELQRLISEERIKLTDDSLGRRADDSLARSVLALGEGALDEGASGVRGQLHVTGRGSSVDKISVDATAGRSMRQLTTARGRRIGKDKAGQSAASAMSVLATVANDDNRASLEGETGKSIFRGVALPDSDEDEVEGQAGEDEESAVGSWGSDDRAAERAGGVKSSEDSLSLLREACRQFILFSS